MICYRPMEGQLPAAPVRHPGRSLPLPWQALVAVLGALAIAPSALGHPVVALAAAAGLCFAATALVRVQWYQAAAAVLTGALPFLWAWPALRPDEYRLTAYAAIAAAAVAAASLAARRTFPLTAGSAYLAYVGIASLVVVLAFPARPLRLADLDTLLLAASAYVVIRLSGRRVRLFWLAALLGLAAVEAFLGVLQVFTGWPQFPEVLPELFRSERNYFAYLVPWLSPEVVQASGTFSHFNGLGALLSLTAPIAFALWAADLRSPPRLALFVLLALGTVLTFSRGALLGAVAGCLLGLAAVGERSRRSLALLLACVGGIALLLSLNAVTQYYETTQNVDVRTQTWSYAAHVAVSRPALLVLGYGYRYFHTEVLAEGRGSEGPAPGVTRYMSSLHSWPLQLFLEFGVAGSVLFALWLATAYRRGLGRRRTVLTVALLAGATGFLCHQALDTVFFEYQGALFVAVLALTEAEALAASGTFAAPAPPGGPAQPAVDGPASRPPAPAGRGRDAAARCSPR